MVATSKGLGSEKDCAGEGQQHIQKTEPAYTKDSPVLSSERAPHKNKTVTVKK
jgi:hypothetical protein